MTVRGSDHDDERAALGSMSFYDGTGGTRPPIRSHGSL